MPESINIVLDAPLMKVKEALKSKSRKINFGTFEYYPQVQTLYVNQQLYDVRIRIDHFGIRFLPSAVRFKGELVALSDNQTKFHGNMVYTKTLHFYLGAWVLGYGL